jgi:hypothetical protein
MIYRISTSFIPTPDEADPVPIKNLVFAPRPLALHPFYDPFSSSSLLSQPWIVPDFLALPWLVYTGCKL